MGYTHMCWEVVVDRVWYMPSQQIQYAWAGLVAALFVRGYMLCDRYSRLTTCVPEASRPQNKHESIRTFNKGQYDVGLKKSLLSRSER